MLSSGGDSEAARGVWPQTSGDSSRQPGQPRRSAARQLLMRPPPVTHELSVGVLTSGEMTESFSSFLGGVLASSRIIGEVWAVDVTSQTRWWYDRVRSASNPSDKWRALHA